MMYCSLKLVEGDLYDYRNRGILLFKEVNWPCVPIPKNVDCRVSLGVDENGKEVGWSIEPNYVWFDTNGDICIELQAGLHPEVDKFDKFVQYAKNDGFVEYAEWKKR